MVFFTEELGIDLTTFPQKIDIRRYLRNALLLSSLCTYFAVLSILYLNSFYYHIRRITVYNKKSYRNKL